MFFDQYRCNTKSLYFADILSFSQISISRYHSIYRDESNEYFFYADWWHILIQPNPVKPPLTPRFSALVEKGRLYPRDPFTEDLPRLGIWL